MATGRSQLRNRLAADWLSSRFGSSSRELKAYRAASSGGVERVARLHRAYEDLDAVYKSKLSDDEKRARKAELIAQLKVNLRTKRDLNNASLFGYRTYDTGGPAFARLLERCDGDLGKLLEAVGKLDAASFPEPQMEDFSSVVDAL